jgi:predicted phosphodiesterase
MGKVSISYTNEAISETNRRYLRTLPAHIRIEFQLNDSQLVLLLVHGSPRRNNEYLFEDREEKSLLRIMKDAGADIMCFGHTHKPYHRILTDVTTEGTRYLHAINTGSAGKPKDGDARGCYVLLEVNEQTNNLNAATVQVEFRRFSYDVEKAAQAVENSPLPDAYATMLRRGC